ncbi:hypothetical protein [Sorangium atrum]|uniref:Uncharacterized protein n=1 Tax=Sorangium atrum TaxID=2995308 RepID=A0ABT5CCQ7_9BACT|nr:hypothetical protein [Sorangium aterium]MDC0684226.1 hypothetical protein [Sorangium aterium]
MTPTFRGARVTDVSGAGPPVRCIRRPEQPTDRFVNPLLPGAGRAGTSAAGLSWYR